MTTLRQLAENHQQDQNTFRTKCCQLKGVTLADLKGLAQDSNYQIRPLYPVALDAHQATQRWMVSQHLGLPQDHALLNGIKNFKALCQALIATDLSPNNSRTVLIQHLVASENNIAIFIDQLLAWYPQVSHIPSIIIEASADIFKAHLNGFAQQPALQTRLLDCLILSSGMGDSNQMSGLAIAAQHSCDITITRIYQYNSSELTVTFNRGGNLSLLDPSVQKAMCLQAIDVFDTPDQLNSKLGKLVARHNNSLSQHLIRVQQTFALTDTQVDLMVNTMLSHFNNSDILHLLAGNLLTSRSTQRQRLLDHFDVANFLSEMNIDSYTRNSCLTKGRTHADKDRLQQDFDKATKNLPISCLQKILAYLKNPKLSTSDTSTFVKEMHFPVKGSCFTNRMTKFIKALEARITTSSPPASTADSTLLTINPNNNSSNHSGSSLTTQSSNNSTNLGT